MRSLTPPTEKEPTNRLPFFLVYAGLVPHFQNTATLPSVKRTEPVHYFPCSSPLLCAIIQILQVALCFMSDEASEQFNTGLDMSRQIDPSKYTLTVEEASRLFSNGGVPRSSRTIDRYCKAGHLVCMKIETERNEKYLITQDSVTERITELQQVVPTGHVQTEHDTSRHVVTQPDLSRRDATGDELTDDEKNKLEARIKELERENLDLKIANRGKDYFLERVKEEQSKFDTQRKEMTQQLIDQSFRLGELEGVIRHAQIEAPRSEQPKTTDQVSNVIDVTPEHTKDEEIEEHTSNVFP